MSWTLPRGVPSWSREPVKMSMCEDVLRDGFVLLLEADGCITRVFVSAAKMASCCDEPVERLMTVATLAEEALGRPLTRRELELNAPLISAAIGNCYTPRHVTALHHEHLRCSHETRQAWLGQAWLERVRNPRIRWRARWKFARRGIAIIWRQGLAELASVREARRQQRASVETLASLRATFDQGSNHGSPRHNPLGGATAAEACAAIQRMARGCRPGIDSRKRPQGKETP